LKSFTCTGRFASSSDCSRQNIFIGFFGFFKDLLLINSNALFTAGLYAGNTFDQPANFWPGEASVTLACQTVFKVPQALHQRHCVERQGAVLTLDVPFN
jgi:hypothetical protein